MTLTMLRAMASREEGGDLGGEIKEAVPRTPTAFTVFEIR